MKRALATAAAVLAVGTFATGAQAHPFDDWQELGYASSDHSHINSGIRIEADTNAVSGGYVVGSTITGAHSGSRVVYTAGSGNGYVSGGVTTTTGGSYTATTTTTTTTRTTGNVATLGGQYVDGELTVTRNGFRLSAEAIAQNRLAREGRLELVTSAGTLYDCFCAQSRSGDPVNLYNSPGGTFAVHRERGGVVTLDVVSYRDGFWRVAYQNDDDRLRYGWADQRDLICKNYLRR